MNDWRVDKAKIMGQNLTPDDMDHIKLYIYQFKLLRSDEVADACCVLRNQVLSDFIFEIECVYDRIENRPNTSKARKICS